MQDTFVGYCRVSTQAQGRSGLGLAAQQAAIQAFLKPGDRQLRETFIEVESGRSDANRPQLAAAMNLCRLTGAVLLVAKLDRLSRDAHFLLGLSKGVLEWQACDMPHANKLTTGIMAVIAQEEREMISARTRVALAAAKAKGRQLGGYRGGPVPAAALGGAAVAAQADAFAARVVPIVRELRDGGLSMQATARELTARDIRTPRGKNWTGTAVRNLLARTGT